MGQSAKESVCAPFLAGSVQLQAGTFRERRDLVRSWVLGLETRKVLQNHLLEAGIRIDTPVTQLHGGWEEPHCQLRGHFGGHWLSALAWFARADADALVQARLREAVALLADCQERNGNGWAAPIPEKYFAMMERGLPLWSPQYTVHKSLQGLKDAADADVPGARDVLLSWAGWFHRWGLHLEEAGRLDVLYQGECAGMLELWADLYAKTGREEYLQLARWYACPDLFDRILSGEDALSHNHANASIPWIQGAARLYEVTGDLRYRQVTEAFWTQAVDHRGMFATTGANAGEFWIPPTAFGDYLGDRTQEHCTVYNMIRVADFLHRWTGESRYADYIEKALYNGILAQTDSRTGMVSYFLPLSPGGRKKWGTPDRDFWCCHGTLAQGPALYEGLVWHRRGTGVAVDQYIPSVLSTPQGLRIRQERVYRPDAMTRDWTVRLVVEKLPEAPAGEGSAGSGGITLYLRQPAWATGPAKITLGGRELVPDTDPSGYLVREGLKAGEVVEVTFPKALTRVPLPGDPRRFALADGPVVLAALTDREPVIAGDTRARPLQEHQYTGGREWQESHWLVETEGASLHCKPLHEVCDEAYAVYFRES